MSPSNLYKGQHKSDMADIGLNGGYNEIAIKVMWSVERKLCVCFLVYGQSCASHRSIWRFFFLSIHFLKKQGNFKNFGCHKYNITFSKKNLGTLRNTVSTRGRFVVLTRVYHPSVAAFGSVSLHASSQRIYLLAWSNISCCQMKTSAAWPPYSLCAFIP